MSREELDNLGEGDALCVERVKHLQEVGRLLASETHADSGRTVVRDQAEELVLLKDSIVVDVDLPEELGEGSQVGLVLSQLEVLECLEECSEIELVDQRRLVLLELLSCRAALSLSCAVEE